MSPFPDPDRRLDQTPHSLPPSEPGAPVRRRGNHEESPRTSQEFIDEYRARVAYRKSFYALLERSGSFDQAKRAEELAHPWCFPDTPLQSSDWSRIKPTLGHLGLRLKHGDYYTDYLTVRTGKALVGGHNERAQKYGCKGTLTEVQIAEMYRDWSGDCYWCEEAIPREEAHLDHYVPLSRKGPNVPENLVISCADCNLRKSAKDPLVFAEQIGKIEPSGRRDSILALGEVEPEQYLTQLRRNPKATECIVRVAYLPGLTAYAFAQSTFAMDVTNALKALPINRRVFYTAGAGSYSRWWLVDREYIDQALENLEPLGIRIAFVIPHYTKGISIPGDRVEFKRSIFHAMTRERIDS